MHPNSVEILISKYLNRTISQVELEELTAWVKQDGNKDIFKEYAKIDFSVACHFGTYSTKEVQKTLLAKIQNDKRQYRRELTFNFLKYAAIILIGIGGIFFLKKENLNSIFTEDPLNNQAITLEWDDGRSVILEEEGTQDIVSEKGEVVGRKIQQGIQYANTDLSQLIYNTLKVPYGKTFEVTLSDGTKVLLNAGSSLKFPIKFIPGIDRTVFLTGEAFFDVSKSKDPFIVNAEDLDVKVLGTRFNISAYPEDKSMQTVLIEGSVQLLAENKPMLLLPDHEASWNKVEKQMVVSKADIAATMAWMNGQLIFREVAFRDILKKLERSYNYTIINQNPALDDEVLTATFNVEVETIDQVMSYMSKITPYNYTIGKNKTIILSI